MTYVNRPAEPTLYLSAALWLVSRECRPSDARESWMQCMPAMLQVGLHFDVVQLPSGIVERGIDGVRDREGIEDHFRTIGITSAVIVSRTQTRYFLLVPPRTSRDWSEPGTQCIGADHPVNYLGVPAPTRREPPGAYWLLPAPDDSRMLCDPVKVRVLIGTSKHRQGQG